MHNNAPMANKYNKVQTILPLLYKSVPVHSPLLSDIWISFQAIDEPSQTSRPHPAFRYQTLQPRIKSQQTQCSILCSKAQKHKFINNFDRLMNF